MRTPKASVLRATAFHEAGHAVMAWRFQCMAFRSITILPEPGSLGHVDLLELPRWADEHSEDFDPGAPRSRRRLENTIMMALGGPAAERAYLRRGNGRTLPGSAADYKHAQSVAALLFPRAKTAKAYVEWLEHRAFDAVQENWGEIRAIAAALLEKQTISGWKARAIIKDVERARIRAALPSLA